MYLIFLDSSNLKKLSYFRATCSFTLQVMHQSAVKFKKTGPLFIALFSIEVEKSASLILDLLSGKK
jgi:hypothetical protein